MPNTYTLIASSTVGAGGAATIDFTSIPQTYTDLQLVYSTRVTASSNWSEPNIGFNGYTGVSTSGNQAKYLFGTGVGTGSAQSAVDAYGGESVAASATTNTFSNCSIYIPNYKSTSATKPCSIDSVGENNAASSVQVFWAILMLGDANPITSLKLTSNSSFVQYSTAYLYGIKNS